MERREHYHPEDIERLLQERSFDELLGEERAYVLRHLSGREEYEAMRALLNNVRDDDRRRAPVTADPQMRADLMGLFRAQHRPQWQIWLNSVGTFIWPKETSDLWRPALAFASLALLITAGVWVLRQNDAQELQLAELKQETAKAEEQPKPAADESQSAADGERATTGSGITDAQEEAFKETLVVQRSEEAEEVAEMDMLAEDEANVPVEDADKTIATADREAATRVAEPTLSAAAPATIVNHAASAESVTTGSHVITAKELAANQSVANATGKVSVAKNLESANQSITVMSNSLELVPLIAAGW